MHQTFQCEYPLINSGYAFAPAKVDATDEGRNVLEFFCARFKASGSPQEWEQRLANNQVTLDGTPVTASTLLSNGDHLIYTRAPWQEPDAPNFFEVLYEDAMVVLPKGYFGQHTLMWLLQQYHEQLRSSKYPGSLVPVPVHRLGRGTSGVLLCACTDAARKQLSKDFSVATDMGASAVTGQQSKAARRRAAKGVEAEQRPLGKHYRALVTGVIEQDEGEVRVPIGLVELPGLSSGLFAASATGKPALSQYKVLHRHADSTLVEVTILTGRPHQIRIHMAALGHPLVGDPLYGPGGGPKAEVLAHNTASGEASAGSVMPGDCGYHLHSMQLQFQHPGTGATVNLVAPVPDQLKTPEEAAGDHPLA